MRRCTPRARWRHLTTVALCIAALGACLVAIPLQVRPADAALGGGTQRIFDSTTYDSTVGVYALEAPAISGDGSTVAFARQQTWFDPSALTVADSEARELVDLDQTGLGDVIGYYSFSVDRAGDAVAATVLSSTMASQGFVWEQTDGTWGEPELITPDFTGTGPSNDGAFDYAMSADGESVAYASYATDLTTLTDTNDRADVFVRHLDGDTTEMITVDPNGDPVSTFGGASYNYGYLEPSISGDGVLVAFNAASDELISGGVDSTQLYVRDLTEDETTLLYDEPLEVDPIYEDGLYVSAPSISAGGRYVAFLTNASNLPGAACVEPPDPEEDLPWGCVRRLYVHDRLTGDTEPIGDNTTEYGTAAYISGDGSTVFAEMPCHDRYLVAWERSDTPGLENELTEGNRYLVGDESVCAALDGSPYNRRSSAASDNGSRVVWGDYDDDPDASGLFMRGAGAFGTGANEDGWFFGDPVDVATGAFSDSWTDLAIPDFAWGLEWRRRYNSNDATEGALGQGWSTSYSQRVTLANDGSVTLRDDEGGLHRFEPDGPGAWTRPPDFPGDLSVDDAFTPIDPDDDFFVITLFDGTVLGFLPDGWLGAINSWDGEHYVDISRVGAQIDAVTAQPSEFSLDFDHTSGRLTNVSLEGPEDPSGRDVDYGYTNGLLTSVTDAVNQVWDIDVDDYGRITELRDPADRALIQNTYGSYGRVTHQDYAHGGTADYDYDDQNQTTTVTTTVPGSATETITFSWDDHGRFTGAEDGAEETVERSYDALGNLTEARSRLRDGNDDPYVMDQVTDGDGRHIEERTDFDGALTEYEWDGDLVEGVTETVGGEEYTTSYTYDPGERIPTEIHHPTDPNEIDPDPIVTDLEVTDGRVTQVTDPDGVVTENVYDPATGSLVSTTVDPDDGTGDPELDLTTTYGYDPDTGEQITVTSPEGRVTTTTYDAAGRVLTTAGPGEAPTTYAYKPDGHVASVTDPTGMRVSYEYDPVSGELLTETVPYDPAVVTYDPLPSSTSPPRTVNEYDAGQLISVTEPGGAVTEYEYSILGRLDATIIDPGGAHLVTEYGYDADGNQNQVTQLDEDPGDGDDTVVTETDYDPLGRPIETRDELNTLTTTEYDERGNVVVQIEDPDGADPIRTENDYDPEGRLIETRRGIDGDPLDVVERRTYTPAGRLDRVIADPDGQNLVTENGYDDAGRQTQTVSDPDGAALTTVSVFDGEDRPTSVTSPAGRVTSYGYVDAMGGHQETVSPPGVTPTVTFSNARGELLTQSGPDGEIAFTYDPAGNVASVTDPLEETVTYDFDDRGNRTSRTSDAGTETWVFNDADQLLEYHDPYDSQDVDRLPESYEYDDLGRLERTISDTGEWETNTYDVVGRLGQVEYSDGPASPEHTVTFGYDVLGRQTSMVDDDGTAAFAYDAHGNLIERDGPGGSEDEITATWSPGGLRESVTVAGDTTAYGYDPSGRLDQVVDPDLGTVAYTYDDDSLLTAEDLPGAEFRSWTRDPDTGQVLTYAQDASGDVRSTDLTWNATGRLASETTAGSTRTYGYDPAGQLTSEVVGDPGTGDDTLYAYDSLGRRDYMTQGDTTTNYAWTLEESVTSALQLTITAKGDTTTDTYDQAGRLADSDGPDEDVTYTYDTRGLPTQIDTVDGAGTTTQERTYAGDRTLIGIDTTEPGPTTTNTELVWDHTTPGVAQIGTITTDSDTHRLAYGPEGRIGAEDPNSDPLVLPIDHLGSTIQTADTTDIAHANRYDPYGQPRGPEHEGSEPTFGYRGELTIDGQIHLRARDYRPATGQFTWRDPLDGVDGTTTLATPHHYADNNPISQSDPTGLSTCDEALTDDIDTKPTGWRIVAASEVYGSSDPCVEGSGPPVSTAPATAGPPTEAHSRVAMPKNGQGPPPCSYANRGDNYVLQTFQRRTMRGDNKVPVELRCGNRFWGYRHIFERRTNPHFGGSWSRSARDTIDITLGQNRPANNSEFGEKRHVYNERLVCTNGFRAPDQPGEVLYEFHARVVVNYRTQNILTAYIIEPMYDRIPNLCDF
jgi:RHS repeat-associated protein